MRNLFVSAIVALLPFTLSAKVYDLESPDAALDIKVTVENGLSYSVSYKGTPVIENAGLAMTLSDRTWGGAEF